VGGEPATSRPFARLIYLGELDIRLLLGLLGEEKANVRVSGIMARLL